MITRRALLAGGGAAGVVLGAADTALAAPRPTDQILREAVQLEQHAVVVYDTAADAFSGQLAATARQFAGHDREHARGLARVLRHVRGELPAEPQGPRSVRGLEAAIEDGPDAFTRFALRLEEAAVAFYYEAQASLSDPALLSATTSIMANQAQHLVVLREMLGREPLPTAFETG